MDNMAYKYEDKTELRDHLRGRRITEIEFGGESEAPLMDEREVTLHLDCGESVTVRATPFQTIEITD